MNLLAALSRAVEDLVERAGCGVVSVERPDGAGAGFAVDDEVVVTNAHVMRGQAEAVVREAGGRALTARVLGADARTDLAVLAVPGLEVHRLRFAADPVRIGALVVAIGNPLRFDRSVSLGVVSALDRRLPGRTKLAGLIQHDASINPGNSGGPLLGAEGEVVGVNTARVLRAEGLGFAVPATTARWVVDELRANGAVRRRALGIRARGVELGAREAARTGRDRAVRILEVRGGGPGGRAGLRAGDLLLDADGAPVASVGDLERLLAGNRPEAAVRVLREGRRLELGVRFAG